MITWFSHFARFFVRLTEKLFRIQAGETEKGYKRDGFPCINPAKMRIKKRPQKGADCSAATEVVKPCRRVDSGRFRGRVGAAGGAGFPACRRRSPYMVAQGGGIVKPHPGRLICHQSSAPRQDWRGGGVVDSSAPQRGLADADSQTGQQRHKVKAAQETQDNPCPRRCIDRSRAELFRSARPDGSTGLPAARAGGVGAATCTALRAALALHRWRCCPKWVRGAPTRGSAGAPRRTQRTRKAEGNKRELYFPGTDARLCAGRGRAPRRAPDVHKAPRHPLKPSIGKTAHARVPPLARPAADASSAARNSQSAHDLTGGAFWQPSDAEHECDRSGAEGAFLILRI